MTVAKSFGNNLVWYAQLEATSTSLALSVSFSKLSVSVVAFLKTFSLHHEWKQNYYWKQYISFWFLKITFSQWWPNIFQNYLIDGREWFPLVSHEVFVGISKEALGSLEFCLSDEEKKLDSSMWRSILFQFESSVNFICLQICLFISSI